MIGSRRLDYEQIRSRILAALRRNHYEATVADLVAATGLPLRTVEESIPYVADEFSGHHRVTRSGEILYYFPQGLSQSGRPWVGPRRGARFIEQLRTVGAGIFKRWLLALLGGYFAIFLTFLFPPVLIVFTVLLSSWGDLRKFDYYGRAYPVIRGGTVGDLAWTDGRPPASAADGAGEEIDPSLSTHEALYRYLFGTDAAKRATSRRELLKTLAYIRGRKGTITTEELMTLTGTTHQESQNQMNELLLLFGGEPAVTPSGTVVYRFPQLMRSAHATLSAEALTPLYPHGEDTELVHSLRGDRHWPLIGLVNGANLVFGFFYSVQAFEKLGAQHVTPDAAQTHAGHGSMLQGVHSFMVNAQAAHTMPAVLVAFGLAPFGIALGFYLLHLFRNHRVAEAHELLKRRYLRKRIYFSVLSNPDVIDPRDIRLGNKIGIRGGTRDFVEHVLDELASAYYGEIEDRGDGRFIYHFPEIEREMRDLDAFRGDIDPEQFSLGEIVFDSGLPAPALPNANRCNETLPTR